MVRSLVGNDCARFVDAAVRLSVPDVAPGTRLLPLQSLVVTTPALRCATPPSTRPAPATPLPDCDTQSPLEVTSK